MGGIHSFSSGGAVYRFGRCIGRGGIGEVFLGLQEGIGGLERFVVIKRIDRQFGEDEQFTRVLLDDARLAASIRHPNVVQILDIGRDADGYFLVMEYLSGETLVFITRTLRSRGERVSPATACRIAAEVAAGLHCAHTATDAAGHPQPIVHREVTPSNVIVCFNGAVKVVDFGAAKATLHEGKTRVGSEGQMSYLAPEQLCDLPIDGRTDVFQLGVCLHELLTGVHLFKADNDQQRVLAVLERRIPPPSELVPDLPKALDDVVLHALERDPAKRPATADDFRRSLEAAAAELGQVSGHDLGTWMQSELAERLAERTRFERHVAAEIREGRALSSDGSSGNLREGTSNERSGSGPMPGSTAGAGRRRQHAISVGDDFALSPAPRSSDSRHQPPREATHSRDVSRSRATGLNARWVPFALAGLAVVAGSAVAIALRMGAEARRADDARLAQAQAVSAPAVVSPPAGTSTTQPPPVQPASPTPTAPAAPRSFDVSVSVEPPQAAIELDGAVVGRGTYQVTLQADGRPHTIRVHADGYEPMGVEFTDKPPPKHVNLRASRGEVRRAVSRETRPERRPPPSANRAPADRPREGREEWTWSDNPDPWAGDSRRRDSDKQPEEAQ